MPRIPAAEHTAILNFILSPFSSWGTAMTNVSSSRFGNCYLNVLTNRWYTFYGKNSVPKDGPDAWQTPRHAGRSAAAKALPVQSARLAMDGRCHLNRIQCLPSSGCH